jgi:hypothetical protein
MINNIISDCFCLLRIFSKSLVIFAIGSQILEWFITPNDELYLETYYYNRRLRENWNFLSFKFCENNSKISHQQYSF